MKHDNGVYWTICCGHRFIGENHSPYFEGRCRNCNTKWLGLTNKDLLAKKNPAFITSSMSKERN